MDITFFILVGCVSDGSYVSTLMMNLLVVVLIVFAVLLFYFLSVAKLKRYNANASEEERKDAARLAFNKVDKDGLGINQNEMTVRYPKEVAAVNLLTASFLKCLSE